MPRVRSLRTQTLSPKRDISPGPPSPTYTETTNASVLNFGPNGPEKVVTRANLKASLQSYEEVRVLGRSPMNSLAHLTFPYHEASQPMLKLPCSPLNDVEGNCGIRRCNGGLFGVRLGLLLTHPKAHFIQPQGSKLRDWD